jgi:hypothetical protein
VGAAWVRTGRSTAGARRWSAARAATGASEVGWGIREQRTALHEARARSSRGRPRQRAAAGCADARSGHPLQASHHRREARAARRFPGAVQLRSRPPSPSRRRCTLSRGCPGVRCQCPSASGQSLGRDGEGVVHISKGGLGGGCKGARS